MADFSQILPRLYTGAALQGPSDVLAISAAHIDTVIDCRDDFDDTALFATDPAVSVLWNGTADDGQPKAPEWFGKSVDYALHALSQPHHRVLCHCAAGVNRGPSTALAVMLALGFSTETAESLIRAARPQVGLAYKADAIAAIQSLGYI